MARFQMDLVLGRRQKSCSGFEFAERYEHGDWAFL